MASTLLASTRTLLWTVLLAIFFSGFTSSIPTSNSNISPVNSTFPNTTTPAHANQISRRWGNSQFCGASTFVNQVSAASPAHYHCQRLMIDFDYHEKNYDWGYSGDCNQRAISSWGYCKLGININWEKLGQPCKDSDTFRFGNGDAIYVINESLVHFIDPDSGLVSTKGSMDCQATGTWGGRKNQVFTIDWGLY